MEVIRKIVTVRDKAVRIDLPDHYEGKRVELIILPASEEEIPSEASEPRANYESLYGSLKSGLSIEEIDTQLKSLRNEWERDIS